LEINFEGKKRKIIDVTPDSSNFYIIFDVYKMNGDQIISSLIIDFEKALLNNSTLQDYSNISIGRSDTNDIEFKDISVSR